jgi:hypothetical protein
MQKGRCLQHERFVRSVRFVDQSFAVELKLVYLASSGGTTCRAEPEAFDFKQLPYGDCGELFCLFFPVDLGDFFEFWVGLKFVVCGYKSKIRL